jgi:hypothetical protein
LKEEINFDENGPNKVTKTRSILEIHFEEWAGIL